VPGSSPPAVIREQVRSLLALLADAKAQRDYEVNVPVANVPAELLCMWFDDLYHADDAGFRAAFSSDELSALARFDQQYRTIADEIGPMSGSVADLQAKSAWTRWLGVAAAALRSIDRSPVPNQTDIEIYVRDLDESRLLAWLDRTCGAARESWRSGAQVGYETARGPVVRTRRTQGGPFDGIAFPWGRALWATDAACARQASRESGWVVRCNPGPDYPKAAEDHFLQVVGATEHLVLESEDALFVERLVTEVPALRPLFDDHLAFHDYDLLPHVFFGDVTRFVVSGFSDDPERRSDAEKILALLEEAIASPDEDVQNVVSVSFCENLLGERPLDAIRAAMGPRLRAELAKYEDA
jgi:hypothetical protein